MNTVYMMSEYVYMMSEWVYMMSECSVNDEWIRVYDEWIRVYDEWMQCIWWVNAVYMMSECSVYDEWIRVYGEWMQCIWWVNAVYMVSECSVYDEWMQWGWEVVAMLWMVNVYGKCWVNVGVIDCKLLCVTINNICISILEINCQTVKPSWKHWTFTSNYSCLHTVVPYNTKYGWVRSNSKAQCSLFTYIEIVYEQNMHLKDFSNPLWANTGMLCRMFSST